ncbi:DUF2147 domain-containing protein [Aquimarina addita]|uniref:DUF2147 domain-containing protein n=1 Tax=Aquimarina addita TaxID=870485 RepID=A0ABP6UKA5_9FLAO
MNISRIIIIVVVFMTTIATAQEKIIGEWKTIDDATGEAKSIVEIYKQGNQYFGKIKRILKESDRDKTCIKCEGSDYGKPIEGLVIIKNLSKDGNEYEDGTILDPENGKIYTSKIWVDEDNQDVLNVRGYIAFFYRTQNWIRVK